MKKALKNQATRRKRCRVNKALCYSIVLQHMRSFTIYQRYGEILIGCLYWREVLKIEGQKYWVDFIYRVFHKEVSYYPKDCRCYLALKSLLNIALNV